MRRVHVGDGVHCEVSMGRKLEKEEIADKLERALASSVEVVPPVLMVA